MKKLFISAIVLLVILLTPFFLLRGKIVTYLTNQVVSLALQHKVNLNFSEPSLGLLKYQSENLNIQKFIKYIPFQVNLEQFSIAPDLMSIITRKPAARFSFKLFDGEFSGHLTKRENSIKLKDFLVQDLKFDNATTIPAWLSGLPMDLSIPPINIKTVQSEVTGTKREFNLPFLDLDSSWGGLYLSGNFDVYGKNVKIRDLKGKVRLLQAGKDFLGAYLPIISSGKLKDDTNNFDFQFMHYQGNLPIFAFTLPEAKA